MKKLLIILLIAAMAVIPLMLTGCDDKIPAELRKNFSEVRMNAYTTTTDTMSIEVITGERENPYIVDGTAGGMVDYTVITITPKDSARISADINYSYVLNDNSKQYSGVFELHPYGSSYSADLGKTLNTDSLELTVTATNEGDDYTETVALASVKTQDMIGWEDAILTGAEALKNAIADMYQGKTLNAEVYVKLLGDPLGKTPNYYWYVAFADGTKISAVLIEPVSKEILVLREH